MILWIAIAVVTALVAVVLVLPLRRASKPVSDGFAYDAEVYKDQLAELERDQKDGLISSEQAEYARGEIGRRLLSASAKMKADVSESAKPARTNHILLVAVVLMVPVICLSLYLREGAPNLPDQPLEARLANPGDNIALLVVKMERHLAENPDDGQGWQILAPVYARLERYDDAVNAYRNAVRLLPPDAERYGGLGETLIAQAGGQVTKDAQAAFAKSLELQPNNPRAEFYLALAKAQSGNTQEARADYDALLKKSPADAPWVPLVKRAIAELDGMQKNPEAPGNPDAADVEAAQNLSAQDRQEMIKSMVASLDERLKENPDNFEGWTRLIRSYVVLKDEAKAKDALKRALAQFPPDKDQGKALIAQAKELGLTIEGENP
ncbi:c-type cytochrome biogenesis protein CcmI [Rhizobium sp. L1K21]|uniref:c-type cytochrome biogenesis protein CcmI n=1 Tax=Rhizobium sp. L1K21 TaxID=2954933 RepID=UPI00209379AE|nr:c-type cytochrome biogenesis protein CcmI [Rhizobium sp. L1K21]MCO6186674.1 c-type cytochrome biogenesis protein CcmI [Rhizobium sp. L1K21]